MSDPIYLDYNATTPIAPAVADAMRPFLTDGWGNPSSSHPYGLRARRAISRARTQLAGLLGCAPDEVVFTSGGTEANNMAIQGVAYAARERGRGHDPGFGHQRKTVAFRARGARRPSDGEDGGEGACRARTGGEESVFPPERERGPRFGLGRIGDRSCGRHIVTTAVEHPAVSQVCAWLEGEGWEITTLPVDGHGTVRLADVAAALRPDTVLVSVMHANNEVGTVQPIAEIAALTRPRGILLHSDGAQAVGKIPSRMDALGVDLYSVAGHKLYAPKGVGALYLRRGTPLARFMHGADHEAGRRAGTENTLHIVGLGAAAALATELEPRAARLLAMRERLLEGIRAGVPDVQLNGHPEQRLPNTLSLAFPGLRADRLLGALAGQIAASAGAACHADSVRISAVLRAMAVPEILALGTVRFSTGIGTTPHDVDQAAVAVVRAVRRLRGATP